MFEKGECVIVYSKSPTNRSYASCIVLEPMVEKVEFIEATLLHKKGKLYPEHIFIRKSAHLASHLLGKSLGETVKHNGHKYVLASYREINYPSVCLNVLNTGNRISTMKPVEKPTVELLPVAPIHIGPAVLKIYQQDLFEKCWRCTDDTVIQHKLLCVT